MEELTRGFWGAQREALKIRGISCFCMFCVSVPAHLHKILGFVTSHPCRWLLASHCFQDKVPQSEAVPFCPYWPGTGSLHDCRALPRSCPLLLKMEPLPEPLSSCVPWAHQGDFCLLTLLDPLPDLRCPPSSFTHSSLLQLVLTGHAVQTSPMVSWLYLLDYSTPTHSSSCVSSTSFLNWERLPEFLPPPDSQHQAYRALSSRLAKRRPCSDLSQAIQRHCAGQMTVASNRSMNTYRFPFPCQ